MSFSHFLDEALRLRDHGPQNVVVLRQVDSTNSLARRIVDEFAKEESSSPEVLILAYEQLRGRGRQGRSWLSPAGQGVYATLVISVERSADLRTLPLLIGIGLRRALDRYLPGLVGLKWPNDLLVRGRKLGGVLIETVTSGDSPVAIVGFGINHTQSGQVLSAIGGEGQGRGATSLVLEKARLPGLAVLGFELVAAIRRELRHLADPSYVVRNYRELSVHRPGDTMRCRVGEETVEGSFLGFDDDGLLRLAVEGQERRLAAAEILAEMSLESGPR